MADQLKAAWNARREELLPLPDDHPRLKRMFALLGKAEITDRDERLAWYSDVVGGSVSTTRELTGAEVQMVIERTEAYLKQQDPATAVKA